MSEQYKCRHFKIYELVGREDYEMRGEKAWELLDNRILMTADMLRDRYGKITINDWKWGGKSQWRGLRNPKSKYYSQRSQHTHGRGLDMIFHSCTAEEVRQDILQFMDNETYKYINSFEEGTSWLHVDVRNCNRIKTFPIPNTK